MKQIKKLLSVLMVLAMVIAHVPSVAVSAETTDHKLTFDNTSKRTSFSTSTQVWEEDGVTVTNNKAASTNNVADYAKPARFYAGSALIVECGGQQITKIVFNANSSSYANTLKSSIGSGSFTVSVNSKAVTMVFNTPVTSYTISKLTGQVRMDSIVVTTEVGGDEGGSETKYDVSFNLGGAEGTAPATIQVVEGAAYGTLPAPTRKGHTFDGWYKTADCSGEAVTAETIVTEAHTLYAKWTAKPVVTISFDLNGAEGTAPMDAMVAVGEAYEALPEVAREGFLFCGWFTDSGCTGDAVKATDIVEAAHTLYALWIKGTVSQTTINFSTKDQRTDYTTSKQVWKNEGLTLTNEKGGSTSNVGDYCAPARFYKSSNMKIACDNMIKIVFVANTNDYASDLNSAITAAGFTSSVNGKDVTVSFSTPVAEMAFSLTTAKVFLDSMTVTTLVPAPTYFDVSFDLGGAEGTAPETIQVEEGKAYGELPEVTREGYTFDGWYKTADCSGEAVTAEDTVSEEHTLYAKWTYIPTEDSSDIVENWGLTLKDEVVVKFNMTFTPETLADAGAYVEVKVDDEITKIAVADIAGPLEIPVSAAQMTEAISLCVVDGEENRGEEQVFTILQYCETILASQEYAAYHPLVKEMLNYGGFAQVYFDYNTDEMANEGLEDVGTLDVPEEAAVEKTISGEVEGISYYGASLLLQDKVGLRFYFEVSGDIADYTFKVNGQEVKWGKKNGMYYVDAKDILAWNLDAPVTVTVNDTLTVTHSPLTYIVNMSDDSAPQLRDMLKALYNYHVVAKEFIGQG